MEMLPSSIVISVKSLFLVYFMNEYSTSIFHFKFFQTLNEFWFVIKTIGEDKSSISIFSTVFKNNFALIWKNFSHSCVWMSSWWNVYLSANWSWLEFKLFHNSVVTEPIQVWINELLHVCDESHLLMNMVVLQELGQCSGVDTSD